MAKLKNVDAIQAVALANKWRWTNKNITIYANVQRLYLSFLMGKLKILSARE